MNRLEFADHVLVGWGAPRTRRNRLVLLSWMQAEGNSARNNPLNTTEKTPTSTPLKGNTAGVQEYQTSKEGIDATIKTLNDGAERNMYGYKTIRRRLRQNAGALGTLRAIEQSAWGTGGLGVLCLSMIRTKLGWEKYSQVEIKE